MEAEEKDLALREQAEVFTRQLESAQISLKVSLFSKVCSNFHEGVFVSVSPLT